MGKLVITYADHSGEVSTATFPGSDLTAANIDAEYADSLDLRNALDDVLLGNMLRYSHVARVSPQGIGPAVNPNAQRESKALVKYYDNTTFERAVLELPCPDMAKQHPSYPGKFFVDDDVNNPADWEVFVVEFEAFVPGPGGNLAVVEEIVHVGRNL